jgi:hypothetical protein
VTEKPLLTKTEKLILFQVPKLAPDADDSEIEVQCVPSSTIKIAVQHLIGLGLVTGYEQEGKNPFDVSYVGLSLTVEGEELRRFLELSWLWRFLSNEWKWLAGFVVAVTSVSLAIYAAL